MCQIDNIINKTAATSLMWVPATSLMWVPATSLKWHMDMIPTKAAILDFFYELQEYVNDDRSSFADAPVDSDDDDV